MLPCELAFPKSRWLAAWRALSTTLLLSDWPCVVRQLHPARTMPARTRRPIVTRCWRYAAFAAALSQIGQRRRKSPCARLSFFGSFANLHAHVMLAALSSHSRRAANSGPLLGRIVVPDIGCADATLQPAPLQQRAASVRGCAPYHARRNSIAALPRQS